MVHNAAFLMYNLYRRVKWRCKILKLYNFVVITAVSVTVVNSDSQIRDGKEAYSPMVRRSCGQTFPKLVTSSSRHLWLSFKSDETIEYAGFRAVYSFKSARSECYVLWLQLSSANWWSEQLEDMGLTPAFPISLSSLATDATTRTFRRQ